MSAAISFHRVCYEAGGRAILDNLTLDVDTGETLVLLGRSGSGKTTALKMVNALLSPTQGVMRVEDKPVNQWDLIRLRRRVGYVIQEVGLFPHFTVAENVALVPKLEGWSQARVSARVKELLDAVGLAPAEYGPRLPRQLSGGQRQRVGVARALAADPPILLLDEPFGALDPVTRLDAQRMFRSLRDKLGKTALFVTHDIHEALAIGTRIGVLHQGRLETLAPPAEFLRAREPETAAFLECLQAKEAR